MSDIVAFKPTASKEAIKSLLTDLGFTSYAEGNHWTKPIGDYIHVGVSTLDDYREIECPCGEKV